MRNLLLDRDGTLIRDCGPLVTPADVQLLPGVVEGLQAFVSHGARLFVVTNQAAIGRGVATDESYAACMARLEALLRRAGIGLAGAYMCPDAHDDSPCRKPNTGLWTRVRADFADVRADETLVVGDKDTDVLFGRNIGAQTARVVSGEQPIGVPADHTVERLDELAAIVLEQ